MSTESYRDRVYGAYLSSKNPQAFALEKQERHRRSFYLKRIISQHFPKDLNSRGLDLGCGSGALVEAAFMLGYKNFMGVDVSLEQVNKAHSLGLTQIKQGDILGSLAQLEEKSLDFVTAFDVIEHFKKEEMFAFSDAILRVLKPNGRLLLHCPNALSPFFGRIRYGDLSHEQAFSTDSMTQLLRTTGFDQLSFFEDTPLCKGFSSTCRFVLWHIVRWWPAFYLAVECGALRGHILSQNFLTVAHRAKD